MSESLPSVAKSVYIECKKCGTERYFKVIAHTSATSAKVKCEVCGAQKTYSLKPPKTSSTRTSTAKSVKRTSSSSWSALRDQRGEGPARSYSVKTTFVAEDILQHPQFGIGYVTKVLPAKIEVVFSDGVRDLVHART